MGRLQLQALLEAAPGVQGVYFQPPATVKMEYPAIRYRRDFAQTEFADNAPYLHTPRYMLTIITRDPDDDIYKYVAALPMCSYNRYYPADNLHHDVFNIFFK